MEPWWHDFYATMAQVIAVLLLAMVVESPIRSSLPRLILIVMLWLCMFGGGLALWILSEREPESWLVTMGQWIVGLPTAVLVILIAVGVSRQVWRNGQPTVTNGPAGKGHGGTGAT